jgi:hypothetical protein
MYTWLVGQTEVKHPDYTEAFRQACKAGQTVLKAQPNATWAYLGYIPGPLVQTDRPHFQPETGHLG